MKNGRHTIILIFGVAAVFELFKYFEFIALCPYLINEIS